MRKSMSRHNSPKFFNSYQTSKIPYFLAWFCIIKSGLVGLGKGGDIFKGKPVREDTGLRGVFKGLFKDVRGDDNVGGTPTCLFQ